MSSLPAAAPCVVVFLYNCDLFIDLTSSGLTRHVAFVIVIWDRCIVIAKALSYFLTYRRGVYLATDVAKFMCSRVILTIGQMMPWESQEKLFYGRLRVFWGRLRKRERERCCANVILNTRRARCHAYHVHRMHKRDGEIHNTRRREVLTRVSRFIMSGE